MILRGHVTSTQRGRQPLTGSARFEPGAHA